MARKGILSTDIPETGGPSRPRAPLMPRGAVGALQSSLSKLHESAVQEIDTSLIDDAGYEDRLGLDSAAMAQLRESLKTYGQQVPVLLRPHPKVQGRYEIVYGRRRLAALRELGLPVKAMVRQLDDHALVMAQGQENTSRQDLTFIEKASFAAQLLEDGYDRPTIAAALSIDLPMVSRMLKVGTAFDLPFLRRIGSAPSIGRDRWMQLAAAFETEGARGRAAAFMDRPEFVTLDSDGRFEAVLARALRQPAAPKPAAAKKAAPQVLEVAGRPVAEMRRTPRGVTLSVPAKGADGFDRWIAENAAALVEELHDRWKTQSEEQRQ